jgi:hypothetical protein
MKPSSFANAASAWRAAPSAARRAARASAPLPAGAPPRPAGARGGMGVVRRVSTRQWGRAGRASERRGVSTVAAPLACWAGEKGRWCLQSRRAGPGPAGISAPGRGGATGRRGASGAPSVSCAAAVGGSRPSCSRRGPCGAAPIGHYTDARPRTCRATHATARAACAAAETARRPAAAGQTGQTRPPAAPRGSRLRACPAQAAPPRPAAAAARGGAPRTGAPAPQSQARAPRPAAPHPPAGPCAGGFGGVRGGWAAPRGRTEQHRRSRHSSGAAPVGARLPPAPPAPT